MEMNKHSIDNFVNEVTGSTSDGISEECNIHSAKFLSKNEQVAIQLENKNKNRVSGFSWLVSFLLSV